MPISPTYFRKQIAQRLDRLAEFLTKHRIITDPTPVYRAASLCRQYTGNEWGYRIERLMFHNVGDIRVQSHPISPSNITVEVSMHIEGICNPPDEHDPLTKLNMDLLILAESGPIGAWHLDRAEGGDANFLHPRYHIHFGGKRMGKKEHLDYGSVLVVDTPRIPHPPMDGPLGIDFVIVSFWEDEKIGFRREGTYGNILMESINLLWKPYITSLYSFLQPNPQIHPWRAHENWHQLLPPSSVEANI